jgi:hypothetical protein
MARAFLRLLTRPRPRLLFFFLLFPLPPSIPFLILIPPLLFSHALLLLSAQMAFFTKRLTCFYCGRRSPHTDKHPVRKWHCKHCDADNYLDEVRPFPGLSVLKRLTPGYVEWRDRRPPCLRNKPRYLRPKCLKSAV